MSLFTRVLLANGAVLAIVTLLLLFSPIEISYPVTNSQAVILVTGFLVSVLLNMLLLRGVIAPLRRRSTRNAMAAALEDAVREAHKTWSVSARLPLARAEVRACSVDLVALALRLRADEPIDVRGAAMVARLVLNGSSPLYGDAPVTLRYVARSARLALDPPALTPMDLSEVI